MRTKRSVVVLVGSILALVDVGAAHAQDVAPADPAAAPAPEAAPDAAPPAEPAPAPGPDASAEGTWMPTPAPAEVPEMPAEQRTAMNAVNAEIMGPAFFYSINYERMVLEDLAVRAGFSFWRFSATASAGGSTSSASATFIMVPLTVSYTGVRTENGSGLDVGGGAVLGFMSGESSSNDLVASGSAVSIWGNAFVGYRYQPLHGGFQFRIGLDMNFGQAGFIDPGEPGGFAMSPWGHMSLGGAF